MEFIFEDAFILFSECIHFFLAHSFMFLNAFIFFMNGVKIQIYEFFEDECFASLYATMICDDGLNLPT